MSKILIEDGLEQKRFRVTLEIYKSKPYLDLRYWYHDYDFNEFKPSRKGISISSSNYLALKSVVSLFDETIIEHLNSKNPQIIPNILDTHQNESANNNPESINNIQIKFNLIKPSFLIYEVDYQEGCAVITLNSQHKLIKNFNLENKSEEQLKPIAAIFVAMDLAIKNAKGTEITSPIVTVEQLLYEFSNNILS